MNKTNKEIRTNPFRLIFSHINSQEVNDFALCRLVTNHPTRMCSKWQQKSTNPYPGVFLCLYSDEKPQRHSCHIQTHPACAKVNNLHNNTRTHFYEFTTLCDTEVKTPLINGRIYEALSLFIMRFMQIPPLSLRVVI